MSCRRLVLLILLLLPARASAAEGGVLAGVGLGLHRYFSLEHTDGYDPHAGFDGAYINGYAGYVLPQGALVGLDWSHYGTSSSVRTAASELRLDTQTETFAVMAGFQTGSRVRLHLSGLGGIAVGRFERTLEVGPVADTHASFSERLYLGGQVGLEVAPTKWLLLGARARLAFTLGDEEMADLGGTFAGLTAAVIL